MAGIFLLFLFFIYSFINFTFWMDGWICFIWKQKPLIAILKALSLWGTENKNLAAKLWKFYFYKQK